MFPSRRDKVPAISLFLLFLIRISNTSGQAVTIRDGDAYSEARPCVQDCIYYIHVRNGCQFVDSCLCRPDLRNQFLTYLSTCIDKGCENTVDVRYGVSMYQSYCAGKPTGDSSAPAEATPATTEVLQATVTEEQTFQETTSTTNYFTELVEETATTTRTTFATEVLSDISTYTSLVGTVTTQIPSSVTMIVYETFTTRIDSVEALQQAVESWGFSSDEGLGAKGKAAIGLGVLSGVLLVAFLITLCCFLNRRNEFKKAKGYGGSGMGGNQGWPAAGARPEYT